MTRTVSVATLTIPLLFSAGLVACSSNDSAAPADAGATDATASAATEDAGAPFTDGGAADSASANDASVGGGDAASVLAGRVTVSGKNLLRDGVVWTPHGLVSIAFVAPPAAQQGVFLNAYQHYSAAELAAMKAWGADTVRFQVSQPGLDPQSSLYTASFVSTVQDAVLAARAAGLNVIVSVQDETQSGETTPATLPDAATQRVWTELAPLFNGDTGILYEILNEPELALNATNWQAWATAMNTVIATIRGTGSANVVVADGLNFALSLDGAPPLTDSANEVAYAAHPYFHNAADQTQSTWEGRFGNLAATAPVILTEWTTIANANYFCDDAGTTQAAALSLLQYLQSRGVGLTAYAYDFGGDTFGSAVVDFKGTPSTFANGLPCGAVDFGPGTLIQSWYQTGTVPSTLQ